ncbi:hypothetical protein [Actinomadura soli]|uniref:hypothetical protein n=1 Tax=Actinomadura soli TaxID=2508997 RepID=UPI001E55736D|nr:hypothetical protein [Actinomadura soli]
MARAFGIPVGTVRSRLNRARRKVRAALGGTNPLQADPMGGGGVTMDDLELIRDFGRDLEHQPAASLLRQRRRLVDAATAHKRHDRRGPGRWTLFGALAAVAAAAVTATAIIVPAPAPEDPNRVVWDPAGAERMFAPFRS